MNACLRVYFYFEHLQILFYCFSFRKPKEPTPALPAKRAGLASVFIEDDDVSIILYYSHISKMAPRMAAVLQALGKLCSFSYVLFVFFVVLRVRCC